MPKHAEIIENLTDLAFALAILYVLKWRREIKDPEIVSRRDVIEIAHEIRPKLKWSSLYGAFEAFFVRTEFLGITKTLRDVKNPDNWWGFYVPGEVELKDAVKRFSYT